jgi:tetratricopeptide (TPR) repeat protein
VWVALIGFFVFLLRTFDPGSAHWEVLVLSLLLSTLLIGFLRGRRALARIHELIALGEPDKLLSLVRWQLRYARSGPNRGPLKVFEAVALSMKGDFSRALQSLDAVNPGAMPEAIWQFGYYTARFGCYVFLERLDEARAILGDHIERLAAGGELPSADDAIAGSRAMMWFCDGDQPRAMEVFARLVRDTRIPPPSRAVFHYFIGRVYHADGKWSAADQHFAEAAKLGPKTWIPSGIEAFRDSRQLRP